MNAAFLSRVLTVWNVAHAALPGTDAFNWSVLTLLAVSINASSLEYAVSVHTRLPGCEAPLWTLVSCCRLHRTAYKDRAVTASLFLKQYWQKHAVAYGVCVSQEPHTPAACFCLC